MVLASITEYLFPNTRPPVSDGTFSSSKLAPSRLRGDDEAGIMADAQQGGMLDKAEEESRPAYIHAIIAGGTGGLTGDMAMHSLDTVKTRQQGDPYRPPKYHSLANTYWTIWRQEGVRRGLYGGVIPAAVGSFGGTCIFFGCYEWTKRLQLDYGITPTIAFLNAGVIADIIASPVYVPTEVVKTRMQLQGRYNNPHFKSGYNYKSTWDAVRTIARAEGSSALYYGYRATLWRDVPFSALQFAFYERERQTAKWWVSSSQLSFPVEVFVAMTAGGAAGMLTTPLDVVKTRIQTQVHEPKSVASSSLSSTSKPTPLDSQQRPNPPPSSTSKPPTRTISTSSSSTGLPPKGTVMLNTSSAIEGLRIIYRAEGVVGWFRGVGPRTVWTSVQSGFMLVLYQYLLKELDRRFPTASEQ